MGTNIKGDRQKQCAWILFCSSTDCSNIMRRKKKKNRNNNEPVQKDLDCASSNWLIMEREMHEPQSHGHECNWIMFAERWHTRFHESRKHCVYCFLWFNLTKMKINRAQTHESTMVSEAKSTRGRKSHKCFHKYLTLVSYQALPMDQLVYSRIYIKHLKTVMDGGEASVDKTANASAFAAGTKTIIAMWKHPWNLFLFHQAQEKELHPLPKPVTEARNYPWSVFILCSAMYPNLNALVMN